MKKIFVTSGMLCTILTLSQTKKDSTTQKEIKEVVLVGKKPTVENKVDRTVFNVANSSILAGNTTWEVLKMTPLISVENDETLKSEGENVTVYINDRKSVFTGKELKEYLKTIPADNLMKIEVITNPSARYESAGSVINIVLKKLENEGVKGSVSLSNTQNKKNSQYSNFNLNYHKKNFTQTLSGGYSNGEYVYSNTNENYIYANKSLTNVITDSNNLNKVPTFSSTSELELDSKNNIGLILEYFQYKYNNNANAVGSNYLDTVFQNSFTQNQSTNGDHKSIGSNVFYKYYDKVKNKIFDVNLGVNYYNEESNNEFILSQEIAPISSGSKIVSDNQNRNYYLKLDYTQPFEKSGINLEMGGKIDFKNNVIPNDYYLLNQNNWNLDHSKSNRFQYLENLNSVYTNVSKTFFKKLEARIGLRYEYIHYKIMQNVGSIEKTNSYGTWLPDILLKYTLTENFNISSFYNRGIWRPYYAEFNPFLMPNSNGTYSQGNMDLQPNPSNRVELKFGLYKKYYISTSYMFSNQDYWNTFYINDGKTIDIPINFNGAVKKYNVNFNTNQTFLKNKLNVNLSINYSYTDNSDFYAKNNIINAKNYFSNIGGSTNISYTNLLNKNININAWIGIFNQHSGNSFANNTMLFHNISATKIFPKSQIETSLRLSNIFMSPKFDRTTFTEIGSFRNSNIWDARGISLTFVKRFGNQKVKENSKTNVEKDSGGSKN
ncbi:outer membrane beta-barrel family protein [Cloacibacterium normanense]